jgi:cation transport ATPase
MLEVRGQEHMKRVVAAVFAYADSQLTTGKSPRDVEQDLMSKGMEQESAASVVEKIVHERQRQAAERARVMAQRERERLAHRRRVMAMRAAAAQRSMMMGAMICAAGVLMSLFTHTTSMNSAPYVVAWGVILFGTVRFLRGAALASTSRRELTDEAVQQ